MGHDQNWVPYQNTIALGSHRTAGCSTMQDLGARLDHRCPRCPRVWKSWSDPRGQGLGKELQNDVLLRDDSQGGVPLDGTGTHQLDLLHTVETLKAVGCPQTLPQYCTMHHGLDSCTVLPSTHRGIHPFTSPPPKRKAAPMRFFFIPQCVHVSDRPLHSQRPSGGTPMVHLKMNIHLLGAAEGHTRQRWGSSPEEGHRKKPRT